MPKKKTLVAVPSAVPPRAPIKSLQYDLFSLFVTNEPNSVSNTIELWDCIPKYFFTPKQVEKLRTADGLAKPYKWEYSYNGLPCAVKIQPALIEEEDGNFKAYFPSVTEELVEEALKKIFTDKHYGTHDPQNSESWVKFSLSMLYRELMTRGRSRSYKEIKRAIEVMNKCNIAFYKDGKELWSGAILQDLVTVDRKEYIADTDSHHIARLPLFISHAINQLEYRQFNYNRLMSCNEQLARWIYKRLINRFRQASFINEYHFMYSDIEQSSGLLQQGRETDNRKKVISSLEELQKCGILMRYETDERKEGRKVIDIKYTLYAGSDFIGEQKAANKRASDAELSMPVDK
ncbi:hypothetical protein SAMN05216403_1375 [Nitrosospira multiformis ATCC 25196]|uniref:Replication initiator protein A n=1 Tax=Nitrosospira multiformis (strain ATCC 25196 / NCIMB 11849 / C 71) TaxID=323848 RepID=Q2Y588_NITMU|nr:hypothetical protein [Nitrosospira multiformis]ABB76083.1 hypothetical protein Nmul_B2812 [Nitrosospira multiformis ATCC 25196]SEG15241.1 hypothetical protein SAMN05216403_1375 [Nitrosospira multiformis ATCC 25196]